VLFSFRAKKEVTKAVEIIHPFSSAQTIELDKGKTDSGVQALIAHHVAYYYYIPRSSNHTQTHIHTYVHMLQKKTSLLPN
jgi:hypothetical protein